MRRRHLLAGLAGMTGLAGCGLVPEESDPIEANASAPAALLADAAADAGYEPTVAETTTVTTTVDTDLAGDVALRASRDVVVTLFRRVYADGGRRFGLLTAPTVRIVENSETRYDPVPALDPPRVVGMATGRSVDTVSDWAESGTVTLLGTETPRETAPTTAGDGRELALVRARARAGDDAVTAMALAPTADETVAPFGAVVHDE